MNAAAGALIAPIAAAGLDAGPWSSVAMLVRLGLPLLVLLIGGGVYLWGRRERAEARSRIGVAGGFGGPPGTLDFGTEIGFGVEDRGPDPNAGRAKILGGVAGVAVGALLLVTMLSWYVVS